MTMIEQDLGQYFRPVTADARIPVLDKDALRAGVLATFGGSRVVKTRHGDKTLHTFTVVDADESVSAEARMFALWGTGQLTQQLAKLKSGGIVFLCYTGMHTADDGTGTPIHRWSVNIAMRPLADLPPALRSSLKPNADALVIQIAASATDEARKFAERVARGDAARNDDAGYWDALDRDG